MVFLAKTINILHIHITPTWNHAWVFSWYFSSGLSSLRIGQCSLVNLYCPQIHEKETQQCILEVGCCVLCGAEGWTMDSINSRVHPMHMFQGRKRTGWLGECENSWVETHIGKAKGKLGGGSRGSMCFNLVCVHSCFLCIHLFIFNPGLMLLSLEGNNEIRWYTHGSILPIYFLAIKFREIRVEVEKYSLKQITKQWKLS